MSTESSLILWCLFAAVVLCGCAGGPDQGIRDLRDIRQDARACLGEGSNLPAVSPRRQQKLFADFRARQFAPWHKKVPATMLEDVRKPFDACEKNPGYGEDARIHPPAWMNTLRLQADLGHYPNVRRPGVTLRNTELRELPTRRPRFDDFYRSGLGYPFDTLQLSGVWACTPVFVCHSSADGAWLFVETPFEEGWMPAEDVATVDESMMQMWEASDLAAVIRDDLSVQDRDGTFRFHGRIGTVLPILRQDSGRTEVFFAAADADGRAVMRRAELGEADVVRMPMTLTQRNVAELANRMMGEPYGWGGMYENRDCSSTVRDLFIPFGLFLPRNSSPQAAAGKQISLENLSPAQRERVILQKGVPMLTLVHPPGHIMLYVGSSHGRALVLHNLWGLRTRELDGTQGRKIIGRCVITTLEPGMELANLDRPDGNLLYRVDSMVLLVPEEKPE